VKSRYGDTAIVVEPNDDSAAAGMNSGVIWTRHGVAMPAACDERKRLKRSCGKMLANVCDHRRNVLQNQSSSKAAHV